MGASQSIKRGKVKRLANDVIGTNPGTQEVKYKYGENLTSDSLTVTVERGPKLSAILDPTKRSPNGTVEYQFFRDVFEFLRWLGIGPQNLLDDFSIEVANAPDGMIDWSTVWRRDMGYTGTMREIFRLLHWAHRNGYDVRRFFEQAIEILERRENDIRRCLDRDPGHDHAANTWRLFALALEIIERFGDSELSAGVAVLEFLASHGSAWEMIAPFFRGP